MMLCKADFEDIFPDLFKPNHCALTETPVAANSRECIARWEDEGGRLDDDARHPNAPVYQTKCDGYAGRDPMNNSFALATLPAAVAYGAALTMLSNFDRLAKH